MAGRIAAEALEMLGIGCEVGNSRIHRSASALHRLGEAVALMRTSVLVNELDISRYQSARNAELTRDRPIHRAVRADKIRLRSK
jgi:hypothetical protein